MDMEWSVFCVTMGLLMGFCLFGIGLAIGREAGLHERTDKSTGRQSTDSEHDNRSLYSDRDLGVDRSDTPDGQG